MQQEKFDFFNCFFTCAVFHKFAKILAEMKKILFLLANTLVCVGIANAAVRDGTGTKRAQNTTQSRVSTTQRATTARTTVLPARTSTKTTTPRNAKGTIQRPTTDAHNARTPTKSTVTRSAIKPDKTTTPRPQTISRAASTDATVAQTRTGAEYEKCKTTYFTCMDQFCSLKNDDFRRCSCNDRVFQLMETRDTLKQAGEQLNIFNENLEVVGMTAAQATAMKTASEGENALTADQSASKALLQAIMNSIRGDDTNVGGKYSDLNSINITFDNVNAFGMADTGQAIAAYNGQALYQAVYPQCRTAVMSDCNDASLQRAITAYLMAIEQDCNTVQTAIENTQKQLKSAVREGSAMLDLARIENRQKHNSTDLATCISNISTAIQSEEVCGANYHKCLDNGEYIDISTGKPIVGVTDFYKLEQLLVFSDGIEAAEQKLSKNPTNKTFVNNFVSRTKNFALDALDKCTEQADIAWSEYLDQALLDIYYAQRAKVAEIKQGCFDFVSSCYVNRNDSITDAMKGLTADTTTMINPDKIILNSAMCTEYVDSCNNMFSTDIVKDYVNLQTETDNLTACRAVVKRCFDRYGGTNYENFFYPYSGLFEAGEAPDWFTLYDTDKNYVSRCAQELTEINACNDTEIIEKTFGGFDKLEDGVYGLETGKEPRQLRVTGVATEVYNQIISTLTTQCLNTYGRFVQAQHIDPNKYTTDLCKIDKSYIPEKFGRLSDKYDYEYICPANYNMQVDTESWGACQCWENGGRRSRNGKSQRCEALMVIEKDVDDTTLKYKDDTTTFSCIIPEKNEIYTFSNNAEDPLWCTLSNINPQTNTVCPGNLENTGTPDSPEYNCTEIDTSKDESVPPGITE